MRAEPGHSDFGTLIVLATPIAPDDDLLYLWKQLLLSFEVLVMQESKHKAAQRCIVDGSRHAVASGLYQEMKSPWEEQSHDMM
ncbi:hypothetical protein PoB_005459000 [Plakobranchus ocellatus]|uniref:Uncharacterized protein n=1 Tax=Plakobranchus ocellatus TaxID=259542 RepID=A0AAV4C8T5_9GAST|nr:hypothetical protein PoB_005459000 [Plakobranchus ocellatus]